MANNMKTVDQAAAEWGICVQRVRQLLKAGRIPGAYRDVSKAHADWVIPKDAKKPEELKAGRPSK
jgi:hypothetical protein